MVITLHCEELEELRKFLTSGRSARQARAAAGSSHGGGGGRGGSQTDQRNFPGLFSCHLQCSLFSSASAQTMAGPAAVKY